MGDTTIITSESEPDPPPATDAGVAAGAALATAGQASEDAAEADATAAEAVTVASVAAADSGDALAEARAAKIAAMSTQEKLDQLIALQLSNQMAAAETSVAAAPTAAPAVEQPPRSVRKKNKRTWRERWEGPDGDAA